MKPILTQETMERIVAAILRGESPDLDAPVAELEFWAEVSSEIAAMPPGHYVDIPHDIQVGELPAKGRVVR